MADDPYRAYNFALQIAGVTSAGFVEASGLGANIDVIAYREAGAGQSVRYLPGQINFTPVTLRYGVTASRELWSWFESISAERETRNVSIVQFGNDGTNESFRWNLFNAWPSQFRVGAFNSMTNTVALEEITLVYDRLEND